MGASYYSRPPYVCTSTYIWWHPTIVHVDGGIPIPLHTWWLYGGYLMVCYKIVAHNINLRMFQSELNIKKQIDPCLEPLF